VFTFIFRFGKGTYVRDKEAGLEIKNEGFFIFTTSAKFEDVKVVEQVSAKHFC
jgi:adenosylcobinamide amidohydrolase